MSGLAAGPIGVFDSGIGGLSVWREIARRLPSEDTIYYADQLHMPYGNRAPSEIEALSHGIARFLVDSLHCKAVVVACNTASAAALKSLRATYPHLTVLGMEPAVKPAALLTKSGTVGVLATAGTFRGRLYEATTRRHASGVRVIEQACTGLAELIEQGDPESPEVEALLRGFLSPIVEAGADVLVLACTHYPFAEAVIRKIVGPSMTIIDPAPAIARYLDEVLSAAGVLAPEPKVGQVSFYTSGDPEGLKSVLQRVMGIGNPKVLRH